MPKADPGKIATDLIGKISKAKQVGNVIQVLKHLPNKHEALNSNPSTIKKKKVNKLWI
jgi:hypothetical protein